MTTASVTGGAARLPLSVALPTWIKIALLSFGGPAGQIGVMHRLLVEERGWVDEKRFLHATSYCMLLPGPEAQQLATYLGWLLHGTRGGLIAGSLFIIPGFVSILVLSLLYAEYRDTTLLGAVFYGLKPAVMAVVLDALLRMGRRTLTSRTRALVAAGAFVAIFFFLVPFPLIILAAALIGYAGPRLSGPRPVGADGISVSTVDRVGRPTVARTARTAVLWLTIWFVPIEILALVFGRDSIFVTEAIFFSKAAVVTFGGAYAVLSYIAQQAVEVYQWLAPGEMLDGLGMAETTPGPLIQVVQFVGYMGAFRQPGALSPVAAGALGSLVTAWVTFVPCFLFVLAGAPVAEHLRGRRSLDAALATISAAIVGVILNLTVWFSVHTLFGEAADVMVGPLRLLIPVWESIDPATLILAIAASVAMLRFRVSMLATLAGTALVGLLYRLVLG